MNVFWLKLDNLIPFHQISRKISIAQLISFLTFVLIFVNQLLKLHHMQQSDLDLLMCSRYLLEVRS